VSDNVMLAQVNSGLNLLVHIRLGWSRIIQVNSG
jgi:hypothetical protein